VVFYVVFGLAFALVFRALAIRVLEFISTLPTGLSTLAEEMLERADGLRRLANSLEEARLRRGRT